MIKEAEQNAENDAKKRESIEGCERGQKAMIHDTEKAIEEFKNQLDKEGADEDPGTHRKSSQDDSVRRGRGCHQI